MEEKSKDGKKKSKSQLPEEEPIKSCKLILSAGKIGKNE